MNWSCFFEGHDEKLSCRWTKTEDDDELWCFWYCQRCRRILRGHDTMMRSRRGRKPWRAA